MPVQINEMIIRANIVEDNIKTNDKSNAPAFNEGQQGKEEIIKECVAIVMELLDKKNKR